MFARLLRAVAALLLVGTALNAHAKTDPDVAGSRDHPLLSRIPGYYINQYSQQDGVFRVDPYVDGTSARLDTIPFEAEGKVTKIVYYAYTGTTPPTQDTAILRNYKRALESIGAVAVNKYSGVIGHHVYKLQRDTGPVFVDIYTGGPSGDLYTLTIIETRPAAQLVTANALYDALNKDGFVALYINFDTNKAAIKPDAQGTISDIVALLRNNPNLKLSVDGHTDNVGDATSNKALSLARAQAVVQAVVKQGIDNKRLSAQGFGAERPVADNRSDDGRAKNRRVELVKK